MKKQETAKKMPKGKMVAWATRPISLGAITIIIGFFSLYCTNTLGLSPALVGSLLMASKIFDGITDLIAGWIVDNTNTRWGKGRPYELCIIGAWICMWALFTVPENGGSSDSQCGYSSCIRWCFPSFQPCSMLVRQYI